LSGGLDISASISTSELAVNAFLVVLGACVSVGLALWVDVSGIAERLKARRKAQPSTNRDDDFFESWPPYPEDKQAARTPKTHRLEPLDPVIPDGWATGKKSRKSDWLATLLLVITALRALLLGIVLVVLAFGLVSLRQEIGLPEDIVAPLAFTLFLLGLFAISWTWAERLPLSMAVRILLGAALPVALLGSSVVSVATESGWVRSLSSALAWVVVGAPALSICLRMWRTTN
jgi:hypothetical protein